MSRGDGRALQKAAEVLSEHAIAKGPRDFWRLDTTQAIIDSYLDALLSELPEEAVEAANGQLRQYLGISWDKPVTTQAVIRAFLLSLRSSSRGQTDDV